MVVNKITGVTNSERDFFLQSSCFREYVETVKKNGGEILKVLLFNLKRTGQYLHSALAEVTLKYYDGEIQARNVFFRGKSVVIIPFFMQADTFSVLMVKQNRIALGGTSLEFPAGGVESNESPRQAAKRELEEETGISVCTDKLINLGNEFIICESAFSETASWFAFSLDERQVIRSQNKYLNHESNGEIINLAFVPFSELITINTFQIHCGLSLLRDHLEKTNGL